MGLFGALIRTAVNVVALPVTLPLAIAKDAVSVMCADPARETGNVIARLKREADEDAK